MSHLDQWSSNFGRYQNLLRDLSQRSFPGPTPRVPDSVGLGWGPRTHTRGFPGDADTKNIKFKTDNDEMLGEPHEWGWERVLGKSQLKNVRCQVQYSYIYRCSSGVLIRWYPKRMENFLTSKLGSGLRRSALWKILQPGPGVLITKPHHKIGL